MARLSRHRKAWIGDVVIGGLAGGLVGAIVAVNLVIVAGPVQGYEADLAEVFEHSTTLGLATTVILAGGPVIGVVVARRVRRRRSSGPTNRRDLRP